MLSSKKTTQYLFVAYLFLLSWCILLKFENQLVNIVFFRDRAGTCVFRIPHGRLHAAC